MTDSREAKVDLMEKVVDLEILYKIKENMNGRVMIETRLNGKMVIPTEEVLILIEEEAILIVEVVFMVIVLDVAKNGIDVLNVDILKVGRIIEML